MVFDGVRSLSFRDFSMFFFLSFFFLCLWLSIGRTGEMIHAYTFTDRYGPNGWTRDGVLIGVFFDDEMDSMEFLSSARGLDSIFIWSVV